MPISRESTPCGSREIPSSSSHRFPGVPVETAMNRQADGTGLHDRPFISVPRTHRSKTATGQQCLPDTHAPDDQTGTAFRMDDAQGGSGNSDRYRPAGTLRAYLHPGPRVSQTPVPAPSHCAFAIQQDACASERTLTRRLPTDRHQ